MAGRLVLLRHVVLSIPIYYFMLLNLTQDGFKTLKPMCQGKSKDPFDSLGQCDKP